MLPFALLGWPVIVSIQPFADIVSCDTCHDGDYEGNEIFHTFHPLSRGLCYMPTVSVYWIDRIKIEPKIIKIYEAVLLLKNTENSIEFFEKFSLNMFRILEIQDR
jgi:hypothetical protein